MRKCLTNHAHGVVVRGHEQLYLSHEHSVRRNCISARASPPCSRRDDELSHSADAVRSGDLVFLAGILPADADGALVGEGDVVAQARFVFGELVRILAAAGTSSGRVTKVNVFLTDVDDRSRIDPVRREIFGETRPAPTLVEVSALALPGARIEVEAVAVAP